MLLLLAGTAAFYLLHGKFLFWVLPADGQMKSSEWANFGTFLGGVAGPAVTVVTGIVVALAFILQSDALSQGFKQANMAASQASLAWVRQRLDEVLQRPIGENGETIQWAVISHAHRLGPTLTTDATNRLKQNLPELLYWLHSAVEQVELFRSNQRDHSYTLQHEREFYRSIFSFLHSREVIPSGSLWITLGHVSTHFQQQSRS